MTVAQVPSYLGVPIFLIGNPVPAPSELSDDSRSIFSSARNLILLPFDGINYISSNGFCGKRKGYTDSLLGKPRVSLDDLLQRLARGKLL